MACLEVATSGLLAVALRSLACGNGALRGCAYQALALYDEALEASDFRSALQCLALALHHGCNAKHCQWHALPGCNHELPAPQTEALRAISRLASAARSEMRSRKLLHKMLDLDPYLLHSSQQFHGIVLVVAPRACGGRMMGEGQRSSFWLHLLE